MIRANTQRNQAEIVLNRLLHRPLEESFRTDKTNLELETGFDKIKRYVDNPRSFSLFRDFMAKEGLSASPELRRLDAAIASQRRVLLSAQRAFWAPEVALTGNTTSWLRGGGGSGVQLSDLLPGPISLPSPGNIDWSVALNVRFPLFTSGAKEAEARQSREELAQLGSEREALAERIEQRLRTALHAAGASFASIKLAQDAEDGSQRQPGTGYSRLPGGDAFNYRPGGRPECLFGCGTGSRQCSLRLSARSNERPAQWRTLRLFSVRPRRLHSGGNVCAASSLSPVPLERSSNSNSRKS